MRWFAGLISITFTWNLYAMTPTVYTFSDGSTLSTYHTELTKDGSRGGRDDVVSVVIGSEVTSLGRDAFAWCSSLTSITIPDKVTNIGEGALAGTAITNINIPTNVTTIGISAFQACAGLTNIVIPNSVTSIGRYAFLDCTNLTNITLGTNVVTIGTSAFERCRKLSNITLPNSLTSLDIGTFADCTSLTNIVIPNSVTNLGESTFNYCTELTSATIGSGVTRAIWPFLNCTNLTNITLVEGLKVIPANMFRAQERLPRVTQLTIPNSVTNIESYAFFNNTTLTNVNIQYGLRNIEPHAFNGSGLRLIAIPNSVTNISDGVFWNCGELTNVVIPNNLEYISSHTFQNCTNLLTVALPDGISHIRDSAFLGCSRLVSVRLPNSLASLWDSAFEGCSSLKNVSIPSSVTYIGNAVFQNCTNLIGVVFHGDAPNLGSLSDWNNCPANIYRPVTATGWGSSFAARPVVTVSFEDLDSNLDGITDSKAISLGYDPLFNFLPLIEAIKTNPLSGLFNQSQYDANRTNGQNDILDNPNNYGLYRTDQIHNLGLGGIVLNRDTNNQLTLSYQVLQSTDLQNWSPYQTYQLPITNAPSDKMFLRVQAVGQ